MEEEEYSYNWFRLLAENNAVYVQNFTGNSKWILARVIHHTGKQSYKVGTENGQRTRKHIDCMQSTPYGTMAVDGNRDWIALAPYPTDEFQATPRLTDIPGSTVGLDLATVQNDVALRRSGPGNISTVQLSVIHLWCFILSGGGVIYRII